MRRLWQLVWPQSYGWKHKGWGFPPFAGSHGNLSSGFQVLVNPVKAQGWRWAAGLFSIGFMAAESRGKTAEFLVFVLLGRSDLQQQQTDDSLDLTPLHLPLSKVSCLSHIAANYLNAGKEARRWGTAHESIVPYQVTACKYLFKIRGVYVKPRTNNSGGACQYTPLMKSMSTHTTHLLTAAHSEYLPRSLWVILIQTVILTVEVYVSCISVHSRAANLQKLWFAIQNRPFVWFV